MPLLRTESLSFWYNISEPPIVYECSLALEEEQFLAIVGESGCGKTTLLRLLCGLTQARLKNYPGIFQLEGEVRFQDELVKGPDPRFGYVPQSFTTGLLPSRTALSNILVAVWEDGISLEERTEADRLMETTGITDVADLNIRKLSGGQQQRVAICRSLITHPSIIFMDEPFANLDPTLKPEMSQILNTLRSERQLALVIVTHDIEGAIGLADRILCLKPTFGTPLLREWPVNETSHMPTLRQEIEAWMAN